MAAPPLAPSAAGTRVATPGQAGVSLARLLLLWLLVPQLVVWVVGGVASYRLASAYVNQAIDVSLQQASTALARQLTPIGNGLLVNFPKAAQDILESDPSDRQLYMVSAPPGQFILGNQSLPLPPDFAELPLGQPFFYDGMGAMPGNPQPQALRIAAVRLVLEDPSVGASERAQTAMLVQVARSRANREELAQRILVDMLLPMSGLMLLLTLLVWTGIRAGLAPLQRLRLQVEGRAPTDLTPLQLASAPREVWSLANALNTLLAAVHHNVSAQKRFISDAAHQLRTPLAGLKSQTELALADAHEPALRARLQRVHESATRSAHLVNQLLSLARAEPTGAVLPQRQALDLRQLAQDMTAAWVPRALKQGSDLGLDDSDDSTPVWVQGNALLLQEALSNLLDNALLYAGEGAHITVRVQAHAQRAELSVTDNGPGIAPADRLQVLERFVRATTQGNGCGLGLAIVREIAERHGGRIHLSQAQPQGLTATLLLPCLNPKSTPIEAAL